MTRTARGLTSAAVLALSLGLAFALPSCGGGSSGTTPTTLPPTTTVPPCTQTVIVSGSDSLPSKTLGRFQFTSIQAGRIDLLLDWTFSDSLVGVYLVTAGTCPIGSFNNNTCTFLTFAEGNSPKPLKASAHNAPAGSYEVLVANYASRQEALSLQGFLRSETCPAFAAAPSVVVDGRAREAIAEK